MIMVFQFKPKMRFWGLYLIVFKSLMMFSWYFRAKYIIYIFFFANEWNRRRWIPAKIHVADVADTVQNLLLGTRSRDVVLNTMKALRFDLDVLCPKKPFYTTSHPLGSCRAAVELFPIWQKRLMPKQTRWKRAGQTQGAAPSDVCKELL